MHVNTLLYKIQELLRLPEAQKILDTCDKCCPNTNPYIIYVPCSKEWLIIAKKYDEIFSNRRSKIINDLALQQTISLTPIIIINKFTFETLSSISNKGNKLNNTLFEIGKEINCGTYDTNIGYIYRFSDPVQVEYYCDFKRAFWHNLSIYDELIINNKIIDDDYLETDIYGNILAEGALIDGKLHGIYVIHDGKNKLKGEYYCGIMHGTWRLKQNDKIISIKTYYNGIPEGIWSTFSYVDNCTDIDEVYYKDGIVTKHITKMINANGKLCGKYTCTNYNNENKTIETQYYNDVGYMQKSEICTYYTDHKECEIIIYNEKGKILEKHKTSKIL